MLEIVLIHVGRVWDNMFEVLWRNMEVRGVLMVKNASAKRKR